MIVDIGWTRLFAVHDKRGASGNGSDSELEAGDDGEQGDDGGGVRVRARVAPRDHCVASTMTNCLYMLSYSKSSPAQILAHP